jgi:hypothetical protein
MGLRWRGSSQKAAIDSNDDGLARRPAGSYWDPRDLQTPRLERGLLRPAGPP